MDGGGLSLDLPASGTTCDLIAITGDLVLNGVNTIFASAPDGAGGGCLNLTTYAAKTGSGFLVLPNGSTTMGNMTLTVGPTSVTLTVGVGGIAGTIWKGTVNGTWDTSTANWTRNGVASQNYVEGDSVAFDDTATALTITSGGTLSPSSVTANNSTKNFTINAAIGGTGTPLVKSGTGTLTLGGTNSYTGGTFINAGTLALGAGPTGDSKLGATTGDLTFNGTGTIAYSDGLNLNVDRTVTINAGANVLFSNAITVNGILTGSGSFRANTADAFIFSNATTIFRARSLRKRPQAPAMAWIWQASATARVRGSST